ncbi:hypothetical protein [Methylobrevis pamukkalensis]|uniref:Uncharacterized protein n=1 Tax=Methylobrevis pamukkalensis TaxID=1439726 RepID=A0A1E3GY76_9HYPH|nr:hypothetical protein [Methylobrevis pamukkalensis]ODN69029.1 hypothetical protein A6302_03679 [Methylobrevis pamukkalensis]
MFLFDISLPNTGIDRITDFVSGLDRIHLEADIYTALMSGALPAPFFATGSAAGDANDRIIYDTTNGFLRYDADGTGAGAAIHFATLSGAPALSAADFLVV